MATFEKRAGAPSGTITIQTAKSAYSIGDGGTITTVDTDDINTLRQHPFIQLQGGGGGPFTPPPLIEGVVLKDGVLVKVTDGTPVIGPGTTGPVGINWRGPWSGGTAYTARDGVSWLGGSYVALNNVGAGSINPAANPTDWLQIASGGGVIASSIYSGADIALINNGGADIPGVVLSVPAGSPNYLLRAYGTAQINATAANGWGQATLIIQDIDNNNANFKQTTFAGAHPLSGGVVRGPVIVEEPMPAPGASPRNFKLQHFGVLGSATGKFVGPGTAATAPSIRLEAIAR